MTNSPIPTHQPSADHRSPVTIGSDAYWYKDAIIYEAHVRAFYDSNNDGIGDFAGFTQKLPGSLFALLEMARTSSRSRSGIARSPRS